MNKKRKIALLIGGILIIALGAIYFSEPAQFLLGLADQMRAGHAYMDSLSDTDIQDWITRADKILTEQTNVVDEVYQIPVPDDLKEIKILAIDVIPPDCVVFKWLGGFDHTGLIARRDTNGTYTLTARYDDKHTRQLWPK